MSEKKYRTQQFADLAGVTVRTLHHYDRVGLLRPARRAGSGYRLYGPRDLERLEQIVALKCLGLPLKQIRKLLDPDSLPLADALHRQRRLLEEKRRLIDRAIGSIRAAEQALQRGNRPDAAILKQIIEELEMQNDADFMTRYYSEEAQDKIENRKQLWSPELQERVEKEWRDLFHDVEAALGEDPASEKAQALVARWSTLVEGFTGGDPQISAGLGALWADRVNWPVSMQERTSQWSNPAVWAFISRAMAIRRAGS